MQSWRRSSFCLIKFLWPRFSWSESEYTRVEAVEAPADNRVFAELRVIRYETIYKPA